MKDCEQGVAQSQTGFTPKFRQPSALSSKASYFKCNQSNSGITIRPLMDYLHHRIKSVS